MKRLTIKIADKQLCNNNSFFVRTLWGSNIYINVERTKTGKLTLKDVKGKAFNKCSISNWFVTHDYYNIFFDSVNKQDMIDTVVKELREMLHN